MILGIDLKWVKFYTLTQRCKKISYKRLIRNVKDRILPEEVLKYCFLECASILLCNQIIIIF